MSAGEDRREDTRGVAKINDAGGCRVAVELVGIAYNARQARGHITPHCAVGAARFVGSGAGAGAFAQGVGVLSGTGVLIDGGGDDLYPAPVRSALSLFWLIPVGALIFLVLNLVVDLVYGWLDPRIRYA